SAGSANPADSGNRNALAHSAAACGAIHIASAAASPGLVRRITDPSRSLCVDVTGLTVIAPCPSRAKQNARSDAGASERYGSIHLCRVGARLIKPLELSGNPPIEGKRSFRRLIARRLPVLSTGRTGESAGMSSGEQRSLGLTYRFDQYHSQSRTPQNNRMFILSAGSGSGNYPFNPSSRTRRTSQNPG